MPTYEYICHSCGKEFEVFQSIKAEPLKECACGQAGKVERKIGRGAGIIFKGSGFYETDYRRAASAKTGEGGASGEGGKSGEGGSSAATPAKPATPATPAATPAPAPKPSSGSEKAGG
jgi:putative FmdB family regulatory protein